METSGVSIWHPLCGKRIEVKFLLFGPPCVLSGILIHQALKLSVKPRERRKEKICRNRKEMEKKRVVCEASSEIFAVLYNSFFKD